MSSPEPPYGAPQEPQPEQQQPHPQQYAGPPPPHGAPPYGAPPAYGQAKPVPKRRRPSAWWFAVGTAILVLGVGIGIYGLIRTFAGTFSTEETIAADGQMRSITVGTDKDRMIWGEPGEFEQCSIVDSATGAEVTRSSLDASYTKSGGSGSWEGVARFDPGSGKLDVTCQSGASDIQIGPAAEFGKVFGGAAAFILLIVLSGLVGVTMLIVIGILYATGRPRDVPAPQ